MLPGQLSLCSRKLQWTDQNNRTTASVLQHDPNLISNKINSVVTLSVDSPKQTGTRNSTQALFLHTCTHERLHTHSDTTRAIRETHILHVNMCATPWVHARLHTITCMLVVTCTIRNILGSFPRCALFVCSPDWPITLAEKRTGVRVWLSQWG